MIRIVLVDDQELVRTGFRMILEAEPDLTVVGEAADGAEALAVVLETQPEVVLMDIRMPRMDGVEAMQRLAAQRSTAKVVILTTFDLDEYVWAAIQHGASGFMLKEAAAADLAAAVRVVADGQALLAPTVTRRLIEQYRSGGATTAAQPLPGQDALTERETEVFELLARGRSNAEIAEALYVGEATVKTHVGRVLSKLGLRDRVQAVVAGYESGLVRPGDDWHPGHQ